MEAEEGSFLPGLTWLFLGPEKGKMQKCLRVYADFPFHF